MSKSLPPLEKLSPKQRGLVALKVMQSKLEALERQRTEPIAIVGIGLRFPGQCFDPESFWELLSNGRNAVSEMPRSRWDVDAYYDPNPDAPGKMYTKWGSFLEGIEQFDAPFFGIAPREAVNMDPQQRLLLEVSWEALEHAGIAPDKLFNTNTGVFMGLCTNDYGHLIMSGDEAAIDAYMGTGNSLSIAAGRLSYLLGLEGPSLAVDTACSSSLVTIHLACQSLRNSECRIALAGGVSLILLPEPTLTFCRAHMLAADGKCKTFDASADGFGRGEGCGVVVLKRLSDALEDGDNILALIREALAKAGLEPAQISYVETHGTGTPLGDPIEVEALGTVLGQGRSAATPLLLGSVKTNLGHLEAAAGIAGLIKTVLMLRHREIPPHLHFKDPNPHIAWQELPVQIATELTSWSSAGQPLRAGVSSFGFSGTNAHVIVEEAPAATVDAGVERGVEVLALSAKTEGALQEMSDRLAQYMKTHEAVGLSDVCYSANIGRSHFGERVAFVSRTREQLLDQLAEVAKGESAEGVVRGRVGQRAPKVAFLFSGQGSQHAGMGQQLIERDGVYREVMLECEELLRPYLDQPLLQVLSSDELLAQTQYAQPALFAVEYALARQWQSWGVKPALLLGHSTGEYAAACIAGAFTAADGLKLVAARARLMQQHCERGAMLAVTANEELVRAELAALDKDVWIAALNGPEQVVLSGRKEVMERVYPRLEERGLRVKRLAVEQGFHSGLMEPMLDEFAAVAREIKYAPLERAVVSNVSGQVKAIGERLESDYWLRQVRETVRFSEGMKRLRSHGCEVYVEVGPQAQLVWLGQQCLGTDAGEWCWSMRAGRDEWEQMLESVGKLYVRGVDVKWEAVSGGAGRHKVALPSYPFQRQRYWAA